MALSSGFLLGGQTDSAQFSDALHALFGDGVTSFGMRFSLTVNGFTATAGTGYAIAAGRWLLNDEAIAVTLRQAWNNSDRYDALAVRVDYQARSVSIEALVDVDADTVRHDPSVLRTGDGYSILLYLIRIRRGATMILPEDVEDVRSSGTLCGKIVPLADVSSKVLYIYNFLTSGIDREVDRILGLGDQALGKGDAAISQLNALIQSVHGAADIGEVMLSYAHLSPANEWLQCSGGTVPAGYATLREVIGTKLPDIRNAYVYGGRPQ